MERVSLSLVLLLVTAPYQPTRNEVRPSERLIRFEAGIPRRFSVVGEAGTPGGVLPSVNKDVRKSGTASPVLGA